MSTSPKNHTAAGVHEASPAQRSPAASMSGGTPSGARTCRRRTGARLRAAIGALTCAWVLAGCSGGERIEEVSLAELAERPQAYDGRDVRTRGTVRGFDEPRHYWLEDADINRVGLLPAELIAPHLGRDVAIVGRFSFARDRGRRLLITSIDPFDASR